ncbi:MAG: EamA family transporter, partial [Candidatus Eisenbacteria bacterium]
MAAPVGLCALLAMFAFAGNSILCRVALTRTATDPAAFTLVRLAAGALALAVLVLARRRGGVRPPGAGGDTRSALALFAYAAAFSYAYVRLPAGTGALLLFGAVQATMIGAGLRGGERLAPHHLAGFLLALAGLVALVLPGVGAPAPAAAALMLGAGVAWGMYSLRGRGSADPLGQTAGNFARALPGAALLAAGALAMGALRLDVAGALLAATSGALASGVGYTVWYAALRRLSATEAGIVQLSVPVLAA